MEKYVYPAIFTYKEDVIYVTFPDFENCFTDGRTELEALDNARDVLELWLYDLECSKVEFPSPSTIIDIELDKKSVLVLIDISMPLVRDKIRNIYVKKTLTIPKWLDEKGKEKQINFSMLLQSAIKEYLGLK